MAGMGPAPKPDDQRRRRNATVAMTRLPAEGRQGPTPRWPLLDDVRLTARRNVLRGDVKHILREIDECEDGRRRGALNRELGRAQEQLAVITEQLRLQRKMERDLWVELWRTPQAAAWERNGWARDVATYVRHKVLGELGDLDSAKEARQWSDRLGLNPLAMMRLRWEVAGNELGARREDKGEQPSPAAGQTARSRLRVVDPGAVAG